MHVATIFWKIWERFHQEYFTILIIRFACVFVKRTLEHYILKMKNKMILVSQSFKYTQTIEIILKLPENFKARNSTSKVLSTCIL